MLYSMHQHDHIADQCPDHAFNVHLSNKINPLSTLLHSMSVKTGDLSANVVRAFKF